MTRTMAMGGVLALVAGPAAAGVPSFESRDLARAAAMTAVGTSVRLESVMTDTGEPAAFVLERFRVFTEDARIIVHGEGGQTVLPPPAHTYFRGVVDGRPGSRVFLTVRQDGATEGVVNDAGSFYLIGGEESPAKVLRTGPLEMRRVDPVMLKSASGEGFQCGNDKLPPAPPSFDDLVGGTAAGEPAFIEKAIPAYTARVAIETDFELYQLFNNSATAITYIGNLIGYSSTIYAAEINTSLVVSSVSLWTTSGDPWVQTDTACGLLEFGNYWNANRTGVSRTIAHFMSGKNNGGGVAWLGVLCSGAFPVSQAQLGVSCPGLASSGNFGGGYGFTGSIGGDFNINAPSVVWDIMAVSHEIGHNFNSPHTHCYGNVASDGTGTSAGAAPVDQCYNGECGGSGCSCATESLPGPAGAGSGTIMSYCHLYRGSYSDLSLTFGTTHPYGVQPARVPSRMSSHVQSRASSNPSCLAFVPGPSTIFSDGFESGSRSAWQ